MSFCTPEPPLWGVKTIFTHQQDQARPWRRADRYLSPLAKMNLYLGLLGANSEAPSQKLVMPGKVTLGRWSGLRSPGKPGVQRGRQANLI